MLNVTPRQRRVGAVRLQGNQGTVGCVSHDAVDHNGRRHGSSRGEGGAKLGIAELKYNSVGLRLVPY